MPAQTPATATTPAAADRAVRVAAYDTTLRDGAQQQSIAFTVTDKLAVARLLDELGVAYIEAGWPGAIPKDTEFFARARTELELRTARLVAFGSTCKAGVSAADDPQVRALLDSGAPVVTVVAKSDPVHVERALRTSLEENLRMVRDTVAVLAAAGREVMVDLEHFFDGIDHAEARAAGEAVGGGQAAAGAVASDAAGVVDPAAGETDLPYPIAVALAAAQAGAGAVIPCDTNGGTLPDVVGRRVARLRDALREAGYGQCTIGIHTHDDAGVAVAGALAAVEAGARQVQGCVNGLGERTGNANLLTLIADLELKTDWTVLPGDAAERARRLAELSAVSRHVGEIVNRPPSGRLPYVGAKAFAHKAGLHASAIRVDPNLYQHIDPARVGNTMTMLVSEMAGRASIELKAREFGIDAAGDHELLTRVTETVKAREAVGYTYDAADGSFELLLRAARGDLPEYFRIESWRASIQARPLPGQRLLSTEGDTVTETEATVRLWAGGRRYAVLGEGNGPVNALDHALCAALEQVYPETAEFELTDYRVRILDTERGTRSVVRVLIDITDGEDTWSTVGVGTDVVEASWEALIDGHIVGLLRRGVEPR
ncbi:2-isopropylmalate synthase [Actinomyces ruminicola]|uniref:(R)-citramalate synthase n=1 Tax=Actinomyces ruminicola TaxID=332524 RepID=A0A1G9ZKZ7_9ACTO|nr:alpha-isopropylmalate synthase regulatory domain-containing protein [Actinomyces ruminicola]SDN22008.1 2-isopropylmalate synthase [Actinomyces ruminicola]